MNKISINNFSDVEIEILRKLNEYGKGYIVGGAIRDILLDLEPKDIDFTTNLPYKTLKDLFVSYTRDVVANKCTAIALRVGDKIVTGKIDGDDVSLDIVTIESIERKSTIMYDIKPFFSGTNSEYKYAMLNDVLVCLGR